MTAPRPNQTAQYLGLGLAGAGLFAKDGGRIRGFDTGGAPYGASGGPYSGVSGYIPSFSMPGGNTMPTAQPISFPSMQNPNANQQQQIDPTKFASLIKGANKGLSNISDYVTTPTSQDLEAQAEGGEAYGGRIRGFDDGGIVDLAPTEYSDETIAPGPAELKSG